MKEITVRAIFLSIFLTLILATSNVYLALKLGILTSTSIPAAILSMGLLRRCKDASVLEHNAIQTAASAGEAVAGGIVYTIPALVILGYWNHFDYWTNFFIAFLSGSLGVLFSIPLRRLLVNDKSLRFPEGQAIAALLLAKDEPGRLRTLLQGGGFGAVITFLQSGMHWLAVEWKTWWIYQGAIFHFGIGFSPTLLGAGFLIGSEMATSMALGAVISNFIGLPLLSLHEPALLQQKNVIDAAGFLLSHQLRYVGIGAMLCAGLVALLMILKPLLQNIKEGLSTIKQLRAASKQRVEQDMPLSVILISILLMILGIGCLLWQMFPALLSGLPLLSILLYLSIAGFIFSVVTAYFSGMVGVSASPGSAIVIAGLLFSALLIGSLFTHESLGTQEALTIVMGSLLTGIAAIANDNSQDLKVGQLVGATPWKQQLMLLLGVAVSSLIIPAVMQVLLQVYGIVDVMPHAGMDPHQTLPAPTAAVMAGLAEVFFREHLPWSMMLTGAGVIAGCFMLPRRLKLSLLGVAIGMYLPLSTIIPLWMGGMIGAWTHKGTDAFKKIAATLACGLIVGATLMDVILAVPMAMH